MLLSPPWPPDEEASGGAEGVVSVVGGGVSAPATPPAAPAAPALACEEKSGGVPGSNFDATAAFDAEGGRIGDDNGGRGRGRE